MIDPTIQINMYFCTMTSKKREGRNFLGSIERGIALLFVVMFLFWFTRRCAKSSQMQPQQPISQTQVVDSTAGSATTATNNAQPKKNTPTKIDTVIKTISAPPVVYVYIDGLKLREEPYLNKTVLAELPVNATVTYLNEKSPFAQKITLDNVTYNEPWLKVKTSDNKVGWVYGGGVRFYKK